jgi:hypothetical protein
MRKHRAVAFPIFLCLEVLACDRGAASTLSDPSSTPATPPVVVMDSHHDQMVCGGDFFVIAPSRP